MFHIIPIGGDAIALTAEVYRYFNENASLRAYNSRYLFVDTDPAAQLQHLEGIPDAYILQEQKQKDRTDAPQNWSTVADAFDKERDRLRRKIDHHFVSGRDPGDRISGILFIANVGGGTGSNGLIKLLDFFQIWREEARGLARQADLAAYLDSSQTPRYVLLLFPQTRKIGMIPQLKQNAWDAYHYLQKQYRDGSINGFTIFDRDTGLDTAAFDHRFRLILLNLILHETTIAEQHLLSGCSTISHIRFDVKWRRNGRFEVLNYEDNGHHFIATQAHFKIRQPIDLIDFGSVLRRSGLTIHSLVALNPKKMKTAGPRIAPDTQRFETQYGLDLAIKQPSPLPSIYHNIIDNLNFIHDLKGYRPYETPDNTPKTVSDANRPEISIKYRLTEDALKKLRFRLERAEIANVYLVSAQSVVENDLYLIDNRKDYEYLRIRERGSENFLTMKVRKETDTDHLTREK